jgi:dipeptidyl-peptidase-4
VALVQDFQPTETVRRPFAYLIPPARTGAIETLRRHGIALAELREDVELDVEVFRVDSIARDGRPVEGHLTLDLAVTARGQSRRLPAGTIVVPTAQPLGSLAVYLLEPRSDDGLFTWNVFDDDVAIGAELPVLRLTARAAIRTAPLPPPPRTGAATAPDPKPDVTVLPLRPSLSSR